MAGLRDYKGHGVSLWLLRYPVWSWQAGLLGHRPRWADEARGPGQGPAGGHSTGHSLWPSAHREQGPQAGLQKHEFCLRCEPIPGTRTPTPGRRSPLLPAAASCWPRHSDAGRRRWSPAGLGPEPPRPHVRRVLCALALGSAGTWPGAQPHGPRSVTCMVGLLPRAPAHGCRED